MVNIVIFDAALYPNIDSLARHLTCSADRFLIGVAGIRTRHVGHNLGLGILL